MKEKYNLEEDVVVIEKNNTLKFLIKTAISLVKLVVTIAIFLLSVIGLTSLVYPATRHTLWIQGLHIYHDLVHLLPWG